MHASLRELRFSCRGPWALPLAPVVFQPLSGDWDVAGVCECERECPCAEDCRCC